MKKNKALNDILLDEIDNFRKLGHEFLENKVSKMDFKKASGGMGVYAHRNKKEFMIRLRIPSGIASKENLKLIYDFAHRYNLKGIHFTTRQAVQLHGIHIDGICDIMKEGIENGLYSRGAGGNFPRNVAISPLSGVEKNEAFDVSSYALAVGEHFLNKVYTYKLPRKLKVSFSSNDKDEPHVTVVDLGFLAVKENQKKYFKVYFGGGLGRNPKLSVQFPELIDPEDVLYHIEAMTSMFIAEGDYNNSGKARIRYILDRMGEEQFINCYKKHLEAVTSKENLKLSIKEKIYTKPGIETNVNHPRLFSQKQPGLYSVYIHPVGGLLFLEDLKLLLDETETIEDLEIRLSLTEGVYVRNLNGKEAEKLLKATEHIGGNTKLEYSVSCIGVPICQMGVLETQKTLRDIIDYFNKNNLKKDILPEVHLSGCPNSCGVHEIGKIGLCGKMKRIDDKLQNVFELHLNGDLGIDKTKLSEYNGDILQEKVPEFLYELAVKIDKSGENFSEYIVNHKKSVDEILNNYVV